MARARDAGCYIADNYSTQCQRLLHKISSAQKEMAKAEEEMGNRNYDKAIEYYQLALNSGLNTFGEDHPSVAIRRNNLGGAYYEKGEEIQERYGFS